MRKFEYKMPEHMAKEYLKKRGGADAKLSPNDYLCKIVNEECGIMGKCIKVILF